MQRVWRANFVANLEEIVETMNMDQMLDNYMLIDGLLQSNSNTAAQNAYTDMGQSLRMNEHELNDYNAYGHWLGLEISQQDWKDGATLSPAQLNTLNNLVDNYWKYRAGQKAMSYMNRHMGTNFYIPPARGDWQPRRASLDYQIAAEQEAIKVYPNPANEQLTVELNLSTNTNSGSLYVFDITHRLITQMDINSNIQKFNIDISKWQNGVYLYQLILNDGEKHAGRFEVIH